jgi:putative transposase
VDPGVTIVDNFTCGSLAAEVESRFTGHAVTTVLARVARQCGSPKTVRAENGLEFTSMALDQWTYLNKETLDFSGLGKRRTFNSFERCTIAV